MFQADASKPVIVAGDPERQHINKVEQEGGITYHINQINDSVSTSSKCYRFWIILSEVQVIHCNFLPLQWKLAMALGIKPME